MILFFLMFLQVQCEQYDTNGDNWVYFNDIDYSLTSEYTILDAVSTINCLNEPSIDVAPNSISEGQYFSVFLDLPENDWTQFDVRIHTTSRSSFVFTNFAYDELHVAVKYKYDYFRVERLHVYIYDKIYKRTFYDYVDIDILDEETPTMPTLIYAPTVVHEDNTFNIQLHIPEDYKIVYSDLQNPDFQVEYYNSGLGTIRLTPINDGVLFVLRDVDIIYKVIHTETSEEYNFSHPVYIQDPIGQGNAQ